MNEIMRAITEISKESAHSENFEIFRRLYPEIFLELLKKIEGKIVISIGGGGSDTIRNLAEEAKARLFVNVDKRNYGKNSDEFAKYVTLDSVNFLGGLGVSSVYCFEISGIDDVSFDGNPLDIAEQIEKLSKKGAIVFGVNSDPVVEGLSEGSFEKIFSDGRFFIFEKK